MYCGRNQVTSISLLGISTMRNVSGALGSLGRACVGTPPVQMPS